MRRIPIALVALAGLVAAGRLVHPGLRRLLRSWSARVTVEGESMAPSLSPGDWLLVDPDAYALRPPRAGELVVVPDPRAPDRLLVKRVDAVDGAALWVVGDATDRSADSWAFGPVEADAVIGRPWLRVRPLASAGRID